MVKRRKKRKIKDTLGYSVMVTVCALLFFTALYFVVFRPSPSEGPGEPPVLNKAVIVDMFYSSSPSFTDQAQRLLEDEGVEVEVYRDDEVTVELYRRIPTYGYSLIILRVHAGVYGKAEEKPTFMFTSENYTTSRYVTEQLTDQVKSGVIDPDDPEETPLFTVGPMFVRMSMQGDFQGAIIVLSSCLGLYTPELAQSLVEKGAGVFVSWDEKVDLEHADRGTIVLLKALIDDRLTVEQAVGKVMAEVGPDPSYGSALRYYPPGKGSYTAWSLSAHTTTSFPKVGSNGHFRKSTSRSSTAAFPQPRKKDFTFWR